MKDDNKPNLFIYILLTVVFVVLIASCGGGGGGGGAAPTTTDSSSTTTTSTSSTSTTTTTPAYFGTKAPTDPKAVYDIVFSDGSATPYTSGLTLTDAQKNAAVAMIFYKGTDCSNDGSTVRTLGVGLKPHLTYDLKWCSNTANGYNTNITAIQCTPSGSAGSYTFTGDKDGSDNLSQIAAFLVSNGSSDDTGTAANYPAFHWAKNYGTANGYTGAYASGWYLPSIAELYQVWKIKADIEVASALCGGFQFGNNIYWSSSRNVGVSSDSVGSYYIFFQDGDCNGVYFDRYFEGRSACAIREF